MLICSKTFVHTSPHRHPTRVDGRVDWLEQPPTYTHTQKHTQAHTQILSQSISGRQRERHKSAFIFSTVNRPRNFPPCLPPRSLCRCWNYNQSLLAALSLLPFPLPFSVFSYCPRLTLGILFYFCTNKPSFFLFFLSFFSRLSTRKF